MLLRQLLAFFNRAVAYATRRRVDEGVAGGMNECSMVMSALLVCIGKHIKHGADGVGKTGPHAAAPFGFSYRQPRR